jgi:hypothetical protein
MLLRNCFNKIIDKSKGRSARSKYPLDRQSYRCIEERRDLEFSKKASKVDFREAEFRRVELMKFFYRQKYGHTLRGRVFRIQHPLENLPQHYKSCMFCPGFSFSPYSAKRIVTKK